MHHRKASTAAYLAEAGPVSLEGENPLNLVIGFPKGFAFHHQALNRPPILEVINAVLTELLGAPVLCALRIVDQLPARLGDSPRGDTPRSGVSPSGAVPFNLNSVLDLFEGRVLPGEG